MTGPGPTAGLVHGMGKELVEPDWAPLTGDEVGAVLALWPARRARPARRRHRARNRAAHRNRHRLEQPAADVGRGPGQPRHRHRLRQAPSRARPLRRPARRRARVRHAPARQRPAGARVRRTAAGRTVVAEGDFVYEVHEVAPGIDLYRDAMSWTPYLSTGHARAAGAALARLHQAAAGFGGRPGHRRCSPVPATSSPRRTRSRGGRDRPPAARPRSLPGRPRLARRPRPGASAVIRRAAHSGRAGTAVGAW